MTSRLVFLTGTSEATFLLPHLGQISDGCVPVHVETLEQLASTVAMGADGARLVSFCTAVIVPRDLLNAFPGPSYNIHPGPPTYPGRHPESWGAYYGERRFGATLHEMVPRVDEGRIVDVEWADIATGSGQSEFGFKGFRAALQLFIRWAPRLLRDPAPLPLSDYRWSGKKTTHAQLKAMCRITPDIDREEFDRRQRAFAEQPGSVLTLEFHGQDFVFQVPAEDEKPAT